MAEPLSQVFWHLTELPHALTSGHFGINEVAAGLFSVQLVYHGVHWGSDFSRKCAKRARAARLSAKARRLERIARNL